jgi:hypothetical protein
VFGRRQRKNFFVQIYDLDRSVGDRSIRRFLENMLQEGLVGVVLRMTFGAWGCKNGARSSPRGYRINGYHENHGQVYRKSYKLQPTPRSAIYISFMTQPSTWQGHAYPAIDASASEKRSYSGSATLTAPGPWTEKQEDILDGFRDDGFLHISVERIWEEIYVQLRTLNQSYLLFSQPSRVLRRGARIRMAPKRGRAWSTSVRHKGCPCT